MTSSELTGEVLAGRYELSEIIGRAAAVVYRALDRKHGRDVAVKVLRAEFTQSLTADRFVREIGIAAKLTHPHILPLHDSGERDRKLNRDRGSMRGHCPRREAYADGRTRTIRQRAWACGTSAWVTR